MNRVLIVVVLLCNAPAAGRGESPEDALEVFNARILPIFRSPQPSSCIQCHLSAVDLKDYILPSHRDTFLSLRDQGLINLERPGESKILTLIRMGDRDADEGARLIHEKNRRAEYAAFAAWIKACCADTELVGLPALAPEQRSGPKRPDAVIRHTRKSRIVDSFERHVWSQRMRCFPCHTPHEIDPGNPRHQAPIKTMAKFKQDYGIELSERLAIFKETPEATLDYLVERSKSTSEGSLPLLDLENPRESLLVRKPLSKPPSKRPDGLFDTASSVPPLTHMGGKKMHPNDQSYKAFVRWIRDYGRVVNHQYAAVDELPADNWYASQLVVRLSDCQEDWEVGTPVQLLVHPWDAESKSWSPAAIAFTQGTVTPKRFVNGALFLLRDPDSQPDGWKPESGLLPRGRFLLKAYLDHNNLLEADPARFLPPESLVGQVEMKKPRWRPGFRHAEKASARDFE